MWHPRPVHFCPGRELRGFSPHWAGWDIPQGQSEVSLKRSSFCSPSFPGTGQQPLSRGSFSLPTSPTLSFSRSAFPVLLPRGSRAGGGAVRWLSGYRRSLSMPDDLSSSLGSHLKVGRANQCHKSCPLTST